MIKTAFFDTKQYDKIYFDELKNSFGVEIDYFESKLSPKTAVMAKGAKAVVAFVSFSAKRIFLMTTQHKWFKQCPFFNV